MARTKKTDPAEEKRTTVLRQIAALDTMPTPDLKARWRELYGKEPPGFNRQFLIKRLAYRIQELAYGGLRPETRDRLAGVLKEEGYTDLGVKKGRRSLNGSEKRMVPGTVLVREFEGDLHHVNVVTTGFEYRGLHFKSLSAVARHITGVRWNGPRFFGLRRASTPPAVKVADER
jgi:hypothetical protein